MSREPFVAEGIPLTLRLSKGGWNTSSNGLLERI